MRITLLTSSALLLSALLPLSFVSSLTAQAAESMAKKAQPQSSTAKPNGNGVAPADRQGKDAGADRVVEDKLKTCLSRIPADSSTGQRLLAEQGCRKEQEVRSARHAAPEF